MRRSRRGWRASSIVCAFALGALAALSPKAARAQELPKFPDIDVDVNYVYATQLGFGGYRIGGLDASVYSLPLEFTLGHVLEDWRLKVLIPLLYADYDFKASVASTEGPEDRLFVRGKQRTLSTEPKLKLEIPILEQWTVSPLAAFGVGAAFDSEFTFFLESDPSNRFRQTSSTFWYYTYQVGISSLLQEDFDRWTLSLGNAFIYAGTTEFHSDEDVQGYGALETGVEARHPLGFRIGDYEPDASLFYVWYYFTPKLHFTRVTRDNLEVDNLSEIGLTFGADRETPFEIPVLGNPRVGVSYRFGNDLDAVRLNLGFPF